MKIAKAEITAGVQCPECLLRSPLVAQLLVAFLQGSDIQCICPYCKKQFKIEGVK